MLNKQITKIVNELKNYSFVKAIFLFGSKARKKATKVSDIDICIIDKPKCPKNSRKKILVYAENKIDISFFSELPLYIQYHVLKGKPLFVKDKEFVIELKEKTLLEYFDMKPILDEGLKIRKEYGYRVAI